MKTRVSLAVAVFLTAALVSASPGGTGSILPVLLATQDPLIALRPKYPWGKSGAAMYLTNRDLADLVNRMNAKDLKGSTKEDNEAIALLVAFLKRYDGAKVPFVMLDLTETAAAYMPEVNGGYLYRLTQWTSADVAKIAVWVDRNVTGRHQVAIALTERLKSGAIALSDASCEVAGVQEYLSYLPGDRANLDVAFTQFLTANSEELNALAEYDKPLHDSIVAVAHLGNRNSSEEMAIANLLTASNQKRASKELFPKMWAEHGTHVAGRIMGGSDSVWSANADKVLGAYLSPTYIKAVPTSDGWSYASYEPSIVKPDPSEAAMLRWLNNHNIGLNVTPDLSEAATFEWVNNYNLGLNSFHFPSASQQKFFVFGSPRITPAVHCGTVAAASDGSDRCVMVWTTDLSTRTLPFSY